MRAPAVCAVVRRRTATCALDRALVRQPGLLLLDEPANHPDPAHLGRNRGPPLAALDAVVLVLAFGFGMACTLTAVGFVTIRGFSLFSRSVRGGAAAAVAVPIVGCFYLVGAAIDRTS
ncbi:hypothetical protein [Herbidospora mongoliensis]|uniref:hypothetical protein n=1 Tax=Herbidospora mongoliensis TaxID=688067 RepID=UPI001C3F27AC|nr:hypothetical protein [Herbidospora mongoliensis]